MDERRPNPQQVLHAIREQDAQESHGKLKIFFGYAAGVGKTYAMLQAAHQARKNGVDVAVGYVAVSYTHLPAGDGHRGPRRRGYSGICRHGRRMRGNAGAVLPVGGPAGGNLGGRPRFRSADRPLAGCFRRDLHPCLLYTSTSCKNSSKVGMVSAESSSRSVFSSAKVSSPTFLSTPQTRSRLSS